MKIYTLRNAAGDKREVASVKEMAYLAARGYTVVQVGWL